MVYALFKNRKIPLSYFYSNGAGGGKVKDVIGFSTRSYTSFQTAKEAEEYKMDMQKKLNEQAMELKLSIKLYQIINALKVLAIGG